MSRFFSPPESIKGDRIFIEGTEARHLLKVMRLQLGDKVTVFDGTGKEYAGVIIEEQNKSAVVQILSKRRVENLQSLNITLAQGIPARGKMDYLVEKTTELGVSKILPIETQRSVVRMNGAKAELARKRWQKIAVAASKQCGRFKLPSVGHITRFFEVLKNRGSFDLVLFPCLSPKAVPLQKVLGGQKKLKNILVFVGPEGGFSPEEIEQAELNRAKLVVLGANVLKSDTAALAVLSILGYEYGKEGF